MSRITTMKWNSQENNQDVVYDFGATFENVTHQYDDNGTTRRFTLAHLFNYLKNFFDNGTFVMYSDSEPADSRVKIWYKTNQG